jgi:hypothetical protein
MSDLSFHGGDYEKCCLLGYKNPVRTSQETHYFSATGPSRLMLCKIWVFTAVAMMNAVFWDVSPCGSCKNRHLGGIYRLHQLLFTANVLPISLFLFTLMTEEICSSETSVLTRVTRRYIPEDGIFRCYFTRRVRKASLNKSRNTNSPFQGTCSRSAVADCSDGVARCSSTNVINSPQLCNTVECREFKNIGSLLSPCLSCYSIHSALDILTRSCFVCSQWNYTNYFEYIKSPEFETTF